jgi:hypothetical protein
MTAPFQYFISQSSPALIRAVRAGPRAAGGVGGVRVAGQASE